MKNIYFIYIFIAIFCSNLSAAELSNFMRVQNAGLSGYDHGWLNNVTPEECAKVCSDVAHRSWCVSFNYNKVKEKCSLSSKNADDVGGLKTDYAGNKFDHYFRSNSVEAIPNVIPGNKHVLLIGIDGLRGDSIQCKGCANTPALDALINGGAFHNNLLAGGAKNMSDIFSSESCNQAGVSCQATNSGPGWATVFTGHWATEHRITSNNAKLVMQKPHVFDIIKATYPLATMAVVADWYNLSSNLTPQQTDFIFANKRKDSQQATNKVKEWLSWQHAPSAIFYYLHNTDVHTKNYAPLNTTYINAIEKEDAQIQQVLNALVARPNYANEEWLVVVTSDHGGTGKSHGKQQLSSRNTFLILNNNYRNANYASYCSGDLSSHTLVQADGATPHILDFLNLDNDVAGVKHPECGTRPISKIN